MSKPDPWMSVAAAARALGVSRQTVYARIARGHLVTEEIAERMVVSRASVNSTLGSVKKKFPKAA